MVADIRERQIACEPRLAAITQDTVIAALDGFQLSPKQGMAWLTRAIRGALWVSLTPPDSGAERQPNKKTQQELFGLADKASKLWLALHDRSQPADSALFDFAWRGWNSPPGAGEVGSPPDYDSFVETVARLDGLSVFLRRTAMMLEVQRPNWTLAEQREERIYQAQCLSVVFVKAFGKEPTVNKWETAKEPGPWWDFYQRVIDMAFSKNVLNQGAVLAEARRRDKAHRVSFGAGILPDELP